MRRSLPSRVALLGFAAWAFGPAVALADAIPVEEEECMEKKRSEACALPEGTGVCGDGTCLRADASEGWPPKEVEAPCLVCIRAEDEPNDDGEPEDEPAKVEEAAKAPPPSPNPPVAVAPSESPAPEVKPEVKTPKAAEHREQKPEAGTKPKPQASAPEPGTPADGCSSANVSLTSWGLGAGLLGLLAIGTRRRRE